ncbi:hypothetical protein SmJEL517_g03295 [Synchytrium microbalum]|uniref:RING-type E3 ubiquitin transferase n=1 Tax=Synchytrium microbalum TaxID=1806994 RepID=A0A507C374_9FUNG|nr:uncharacterized protein SmJEL517_g03295 [Synchytrium microbalum]TPX33901.1 hypothetical protein SmJEL517_g03295 [Synchytrium microbalum]
MEHMPGGWIPHDRRDQQTRSPPLSNPINPTPAATSRPSTESLNLPPRTSSTSYSFDSSALRQRRVQRETINRPSTSWLWGNSSTSTSGVSPKKPTASTSSSSSSSGSSRAPAEDDEPPFCCNICLDTASDAVVTMCGHLYCWQCIHKWFTSGNPAAATCPVCKSIASKEKCIPIYAHGRESKDPRTGDVPDRPSGVREEAPQRRRNGDSIFGNARVSFGPFPGMFGFQFDMGGPPMGQQQQQTPAEQQQFMAKIFFVALFVLIWAWMLP